MNREEEEDRRRCVTEAMHLIPLNVDYHDGCVVLTILYDIGWLQLYFRQCEEREEIKLLDSSEQQQRILDDYVPTLPCEYQFKFGDVESTNIDSDGRITYFAVPYIRRAHRITARVPIGSFPTGGTSECLGGRDIVSPGVVSQAPFPTAMAYHFFLFINIYMLNY